MKSGFTILTALLITGATSAQIDFDDRSDSKKQVEPIPYTGQFEKISDYKVSEGEKRGLIGEKVTLLEVSYRDIYPGKEAKEKYQSVDYSKRALFENKTFTIVDYYKDIFDCLIIKNSSGEFHWSVNTSSAYVFNKVIEATKDRFIGKQVSPFLMSVEGKDIAGNMIVLNAADQYTITNIKFSKLHDVLNEYGFVLVLNEKLEFRLPENILRFKQIHNGKIWVADERFIYVQSKESYSTRVLLISSEGMDYLTGKYSTFLTAARSGKINVGMNEELIGFAWGMADKYHMNLAGCGKVVVYGSQNLCFDRIENGTLKSIY
jgi:hypothetical protein